MFSWMVYYIFRPKFEILSDVLFFKRMVYLCRILLFFTTWESGLFLFPGPMCKLTSFLKREVNCNALFFLLFS